MAWTVEDRLILACLKLRYKEKEREKEEVREEIQALLRSGIKEETFLRGMGREGVAGLIYFTLLQHHRAKRLFPHELVATLQTGYYRTAAQNLHLLHHLAGVLEHLETAQVNTIVWKGAALLEEVYPSLGTRGMCDVDLVVQDKDFERVTAILVELGFSSAPSYPHLWLAPSLALDIHTDMVNSSGSIKARSYAVNLEIQELWQRGLPWRADFTFVRRLSPCDSVLTLSTHIQRESFSRLIWFVDLAQLIQHYALQGLWTEREWEALGTRAEALNLKRCLYFILQFLHHVLEFPLPENVLQPSHAPRLNLFERTILKMLLAGRRFEPLGDLLFLFSIPRVVDQCRFLLDLFSPRPESLPPVLTTPWLSPVGYVLRLGRVLKLASTALARSVKGR